MWLLAILGCASPPPAPAVPSSPAAEAPPGPSEPEPRDPTEPRYAATVVLVAWKGAENAPAGVTRSRDEAFERAQGIQARARAGEDLGAIARAESDALSGRSGALGTWATGSMDRAFERAVAAVDVGRVAPIAETGAGFWVVRREAVEVRRIGQILVAYRGAWKSQALRTPSEARARAEEAVRRIDSGESFADVAEGLSDGGRAGADLGLVGRDQLIPAIEAASWPLKVGAHSPIVESAYGLHVLIRLE